MTGPSKKRISPTALLAGYARRVRHTPIVARDSTGANSGLAYYGAH